MGHQAHLTFVSEGDRNVTTKRFAVQVPLQPYTRSEMQNCNRRIFCKCWKVFVGIKKMLDCERKNYFSI